MLGACADPTGVRGARTLLLYKSFCKGNPGVCGVQALRSLETGLDGWSLPKNWKRMTEQQVIYNLRVPNPERMVVIKQVGGPPSSICPHAPTGAL